MKWLKIEGGKLVNLDHIASVESIAVFSVTQDRFDHGKWVVVLFAANDHDTVYEACKGSLGKCEDYMRALQEHLQAKQIYAVDQSALDSQLESLVRSWGWSEVFKSGDLFRPCDPFKKNAA